MGPAVHHRHTSHRRQEPGQTAPEVVMRLGWSYGLGVLVITLGAVWAIARYDLGRERVSEIQQELAARGID